VRYPDAQEIGFKRYAGRKSSGKYVLSASGITDFGRWSGIQQLQFERLCPLLALIKELPEWSKSEKNLLIEIIKSKGAEREKRYVVLMQRHKKLQEALTNLTIK
jgi:hypothetical protein